MMNLNDDRLKRKFRVRVKKLIAADEGTWVTTAKNIGIPYGSLQAIVCNKIYLPNPKMTTLIRLSEYFKVELKWLMLGEEDC